MLRAHWCGSRCDQYRSTHNWQQQAANLQAFLSGLSQIAPWQSQLPATATSVACGLSHVTSVTYATLGLSPPSTLCCLSRLEPRTGMVHSSLRCARHVATHTRHAMVLRLQALKLSCGLCLLHQCFKLTALALRMPCRI